MPHKCAHKDCNEYTTHMWCEKHLNELGDFIEQNPIGFAPGRFDYDQKEKQQ